MTCVARTFTPTDAIVEQGVQDLPTEHNALNTMLGAAVTLGSSK